MVVFDCVIMNICVLFCNYIWFKLCYYCSMILEFFFSLMGFVFVSLIMFGLNNMMLFVFGVNFGLC